MSRFSQSLLGSSCCLFETGSKTKCPNMVKLRGQMNSSGAAGYNCPHLGSRSDPW